MRSSTITVVVHFKVIPNHEKNFIEVLSKLLEETRSEEGCLRFQAAKAVDNSHEFILLEEWISQEALDQHGQTPHLKEFVAQHPRLLSQNPQVTYYTELLHE